MRFRIFLWILIIPALCSCGSLGPKTANFSPAEIGYTPASHRALMALPQPKGKIVVAVYSFRDQTGQYKHHPTSSSFSTAMTQGATSMLVQSMLASGWFVPVEREGLNNLLTERKIIRATLKKTDENIDLPKLTFAPLLLEGGLIAYETNVSTGGLGAKYFGAGGGAQYRKDQVTLYLRAVNVNSGEILNSVSATKSIMSVEVAAGIFRYVDYKRLLESEIGYTTNEPTQLCVLEAIEKSIISLVVEGILDETWELKNPEEIKNDVVMAYLSEKIGEDAAGKVIEAFLMKHQLLM